MNGMEKSLSELHGMLKIEEESIKKSTNHVMVVQKENKKRKRWTPPKGKGRGKGKEKVPNDPQGSKTKAKSGLLPMMNASTVRARDIGQGTARNT